MYVKRQGIFAPAFLISSILFPDCIFQTDVRASERHLAAAFLLIFIVTEYFYSNTAQQEQGDDIDDRHESHCDIGNIPH